MLCTIMTIVKVEDLNEADDIAVGLGEQVGPNGHGGAIEVHETTEAELAGFNPEYLKVLGLV